MQLLALPGFVSAQHGRDPAACPLTCHTCAPPRPPAFPPAAAATGNAAAAVTETEAAAGKHLQEVTKDDFYEVIKAAGDKLVVVDCFTEW